MPFWSVVRSLPRREAFAAEQLGLRGYETFLPLIPTKRASAPLFAGYFFIRIVEQRRVINRTIGVLCLVRVGDCPARCPDRGDRRSAKQGGARWRHSSAAAIATVAEGVCLQRARRSGPVLAGPLQGFAALHTGLSAAEKRNPAEIGMLGAQRRIAVPGHLVAPQ